MEQTTATSVDTTVDEPSIAVDTVDEPSTAVDKSPHIDGNDESDDEVPTFDVDWDGIRHNILHASQPLNEVVKPINKIIQHGKHITNLRKLLQNQHDGCCQFAEQEGLVQEGLVQESPVQKGHAEEGCDLPDHEGGLVRFNKETSELLSKAVGWDKEMDTVRRSSYSPHASKPLQQRSTSKQASPSMSHNELTNMSEPQPRTASDEGASASTAPRVVYTIENRDRLVVLASTPANPGYLAAPSTY
ncbi:MAG: hypothetical protein LQ350_005475 [Teloschistes chrysophthalmus]|nr:MAG: hypothetical protein LQ350_005475 [Niorma chrysophthalma]